MMLDLLVRGGTVVDGLGGEPYRADVGVVGDTIVEIGDLSASTAREVIQATGRVVTPGFIDMHSHSDLRLLVEPDHPSKLLQGVTFEVLGQDGLSYAPVTDVTLAQLRRQLAGWNDDPQDFDWGWRSVAEFLDRLEGAAVNTAYLAPHGSIRLAVMGPAIRPATSGEIRAMTALLAQCLAEGAVGMSTGLTYTPASAATTDELVALCETVAAFGGYFCPHHRNYGADVLGGYRECLDLARTTGVALHLAHAHLSFASNRGLLPDLLAMFAQARSEGVDLSFDSYPYTAAMTTLHSQLPSWALAGSSAQQRDRLTDPQTRRRIIHALDVLGSDGHQGLPIDWSTVVISDVGGASGFESAVGTSIADAAAVANLPPAEYCLDVLVASGLSASCILVIGIEEHVSALMADERHTVGSDGILVGTRPHPRGWGAFPRYLAHYVRDRSVSSMAEGIRHVTSSPADRIGAVDRGRIEVGAKADIVTLDWSALADRASYDEPRLAPVGIENVIVNGVVAVRDGALTGARAGRVHRHAKGSERV